VPILVRLRIWRSVSVVSTTPHVAQSSPQSRSAWRAVRLSPGISRYSASARCRRSSSNGVARRVLLPMVSGAFVNVVTCPTPFVMCRYAVRRSWLAGGTSRAFGRVIRLLPRSMSHLDIAGESPTDPRLFLVSAPPVHHKKGKR